MNGVLEIPIERLRVSKVNPRKPAKSEEDLEALEEMANSIRQVGIIEPLVVATDGDGFVVLCGSRRLAGALEAGLKRVPAIVRDDLDEVGRELLMVSENVQRRALSHLEEATVYVRLMKLFGLTQDAIGRMVGKFQAHVGRHLAYLKLSKTTIARCESGEIAFYEALGLGKYRQPFSQKPKAPQGRKSLHELDGHGHCKPGKCEVRDTADRLGVA